MFLVCVFELWCIDNGIVWAEKGECECDSDGRPDRGANGSPDGGGRELQLWSAASLGKPHLSGDRPVEERGWTADKQAVYRPGHNLS